MSETTAHLLPLRPSVAHPRRLTRPALVVGVVAATLAVWLFADLTGVDLAVRSGTANAQHVGAASVALASLTAGLAAWGLLATLERIASRRRAAFTTIALAVLAVSLAGPIALGATAAATATLACMHLTAAAVLIPGMARSTASRT